MRGERVGKEKGKKRQRSEGRKSGEGERKEKAEK